MIGWLLLFKVCIIFSNVLLLFVFVLFFFIGLLFGRLEEKYSFVSSILNIILLCFSNFDMFLVSWLLWLMFLIVGMDLDLNRCIEWVVLFFLYMFCILFLYIEELRLFCVVEFLIIVNRLGLENFFIFFFWFLVFGLYGVIGRKEIFVLYFFRFVKKFLKLIKKMKVYWFFFGIFGELINFLIFVILIDNFYLYRIMFLKKMIIMKKMFIVNIKDFFIYNNSKDFKWIKL